MGSLPHWMKLLFSILIGWGKGLTLFSEKAVFISCSSTSVFTSRNSPYHVSLTRMTYQPMKLHHMTLKHSAICKCTKTATSSHNCAGLRVGAGSDTGLIKGGPKFIVHMHQNTCLLGKVKLTRHATLTACVQANT